MGKGSQLSSRETRDFCQVNVFSTDPLGGNPVAVVLGADGLSAEEMARFARWTNLSETTFLLRPTTTEADYRLRIFTPVEELPFAGHPTLGSAHAWLETGGVPHRRSSVVQECGIGMVEVRRDGDSLSFAAPPLLRYGPVDAVDLEPVLGALRVESHQIRDAAWIDNGPGWMGVLLDTPQSVLELRPDFSALSFNVGVIAPYPESPDKDADVEVRAFCPDEDVTEDPVTGSVNAGFAQWLAGNVLPGNYVVSQGSMVRRTGRVVISTDSAGTIWVGGRTQTIITGKVALRGIT